MSEQIHLAIILFVIPAIIAEDHKYCSLPSCPNRTHTLCKYPEEDKPARRCGEVLMTGLLYNEKRELIIKYNRNRPTVTLYEEEEDLLAPQPGEHHRRTVNYMMNWDDELAEIAQRWADQCINDEDECRHVDRFHVRQRVQFIRSTLDSPVFYETFSHWYDDDYTPSVYGLNFQGLSINETVAAASSLLTKVIRQNENKIGCGAVRTFDDTYEDVLLVCNYGLPVEGWN